jgi:hypothetical protein
MSPQSMLPLRFAPQVTKSPLKGTFVASHPCVRR